VVVVMVAMVVMVVMVVMVMMMVVVVAVLVMVVVAAVMVMVRTSRWTGSVPTEKEKVILGRTVRTNGRRETGERKCRKREAPSGTTNDE